MKKLTAKDKLKLTQQLTDESKALGVIRYSSFAEKDVREAFRRTSDEFKRKYKLDIPMQAKEEKMKGKLLTFQSVGCYWVLSRR